MERAAEELGYSANLRYQQKLRKYAEKCISEGIKFIPIICETTGGWHEEAVAVLKGLAVALARATGGDEREVVQHMFGRLSVLLQRDNATLLLNRQPSQVPSVLDGYL